MQGFESVNYLSLDECLPTAFPRAFDGTGSPSPAHSTAELKGISPVQNRATVLRRQPEAPEQILFSSQLLCVLEKTHHTEKAEGSEISGIYRKSWNVLCGKGGPVYLINGPEFLIIHDQAFLTEISPYKATVKELLVMFSHSSQGQPNVYGEARGTSGAFAKVAFMRMFFSAEVSHRHVVIVA
ncbi:hypothetical protein STEG23_017313 [Scotinomys teguina]